MTNSTASIAYRNSLLASLPSHVIQRLAPGLIPVKLKQGHTLHNPGESMESVYFLEDGICSMVVITAEGTTVEVGIVGRDCFVGTAAVVGADHSPFHSVIQIAGSGFKIKTSLLLKELSEDSGELRLCLQRGMQALLVQTAQTAACNRVHELHERLARWLLLCQDRMQSDDLALTHEFLATMLGSRRSSVSLSAGILQKAGFIRYSRGLVKILSRKGLEQASCECYSIISKEYVRLKLL